MDGVSGPSEASHSPSELMVAYQGGELTAFDELYRKLAPKLRGYLSSLTWDPVLAEDLLQETFLQIHRSRHTYLPPRPVQPWAFAIARHVFLMERRQRTRRRRLESDPIGELPEIPVPAVMAKLGTKSDVRRALAGLAADRREAVLLHHVWGFSFGEIGAMLGIREGTAKLRAHRAVTALRDSLSPHATRKTRGATDDPR